MDVAHPREALLNTLYHEAIIAAARRASGHGRLESPHGSATVDNPLCGDRVTLDVALGPRGYDAPASSPRPTPRPPPGMREHDAPACEYDAPGGAVRIGHVVRGCLLCEAAAVLIAERAPELDVEALLRAGEEVGPALEEGSPFPWPGLEMFAPVRGVKSRRRCVTLPFEALAAALAACASESAG